MEEAEDYLTREGEKEVVIWRQGVKAEGNWEGGEGAAVAVVREAGVKGEEGEAEVKGEEGVREVKGEEGEGEGEREAEVKGVREARVRGEEELRGEEGLRGAAAVVNCGGERQGGGGGFKVTLVQGEVRASASTYVWAKQRAMWPAASSGERPSPSNKINCYRARKYTGGEGW